MNVDKEDNKRKEYNRRIKMKNEEVPRKYHFTSHDLMLIRNSV